VRRLQALQSACLSDSEAWRSGVGEVWVSAGRDGDAAAVQWVFQMKTEDFDLQCVCGSIPVVQQRVDQAWWKIKCISCGEDGGERKSWQTAMTAWRWKIKVLRWKHGESASQSSGFAPESN